MPHFMERESVVLNILSTRSRELNRPLSLLVVDAEDVEGILLWKNLVRRVNVFASDNKAHYHMVNYALGADLFDKFNFRFGVGNWNDIPINPQVAWPFDIIGLTITDNSWSETWRHPEVWRRLLANQCQAGGSFLLVVQGNLQSVTDLHHVLHAVKAKSGSGILLKPMRFVTFNSEGATAAARLWKIDIIGSGPDRPELTDEDQEAITDLILWGEEVI